MKTIKTHFCIDDEQVTKVAAHLVKITFGHPRSLIAAFDNCQSYNELLEYEGSEESHGIVWATFSECIKSYPEPVKLMMSQAMNSEPVNLTNVWRGHGQKEILYDSVANGLGIAWEGTVDEATLYMPSYHLQLILGNLYSLSDYLTVNFNG
ncbi:hypothetical protein V7S43_002497 [Phytophthora oleae]|uniref:Uncharacterized protein n=1 Tax=Phytophthora oleae TaxID=2107226 RepID=A0ABD3FYK7_9STRA